MKKLYLIPALLLGLGLLSIPIFAAEDQEVIDTALADMTKEELVGTPESKESNPPELTIAKVGEIVSKLLAIEQNGGYVKIARSLGVSTAQVKAVHRAMERRLREINEAEVK